MTLLYLDTFDEVVAFLRRKWKEGEIEFVATAVSPWHALGIDATLKRLNVREGKMKGVILIQAHSKDGILLGPDDFVSQSFHEVTFAIQRDVHTGPFASPSAQKEFVEALQRVAECTGDPTRLMTMISPLAPAIWILRLFADVSPPRLRFVLVDEGAGTYAPSQHWEVVAQLDREFSSPSAPKATPGSVVGPMPLLSAALRKCSIEGRFLFELAGRGKLRAVSSIAADYRAIIGAHSDGLLILPRDRARAVVLTQPFSEYRLVSQADECRVATAVLASLKRLGFSVLLKPHPREDPGKYEQLLERPDFNDVVLLPKTGPAEVVFHHLGSSDVVVGFTSTALLTARALYNLPSYTAITLFSQVPRYRFLEESSQWFRSLADGLVRDFRLISEVSLESHCGQTTNLHRGTDDPRTVLKPEAMVALTHVSMGHRKRLSIIIPVNHDADVTGRCLHAIARHTDCPYEVILVDNASYADVKTAIHGMTQRLDRAVVVSNPENYGYPRACNQGLAIGTGDYFVVLNNDVVVTPHWASRLLAAFAVDPRLGVVGPRTNFASGPQQVDGCDYTEETLDQWSEAWYQKHASTLRPISRLVGFLMVIKREVVDEIGGFDPLFGTGNFEDDDFSLRAQLAGYRLAIADYVFVHHYGSRSFRKRREEYRQLLETNRRLFAAKWDLVQTAGGYVLPAVSQRYGRYHPDLFIPLSFESMFSPDLEPLDLGHPSARRVLCIPDPSDIRSRWLDIAHLYLRTFGPDDGTALVVRVEPADNAWLQHVVGCLIDLGRSLGIDLSTRNDVIVEARKLPSAERGKVYRAATVYAPSPGVRREALIREATACGLTVLTDLRADVLRKLLAERGAPSGG